MGPPESGPAVFQFAQGACSSGRPSAATSRALAARPSGAKLGEQESGRASHTKPRASEPRLWRPCALWAPEVCRLALLICRRCSGAAGEMVAGQRQRRRGAKAAVRARRPSLGEAYLLHTWRVFRPLANCICAPVRVSAGQQASKLEFGGRKKKRSNRRGGPLWATLGLQRSTARLARSLACLLGHAINSG